MGFLVLPYPTLRPVAPGLPSTAVASALSEQPFTPAALEELLAPIALYADALLAQILSASANPQELLDAADWLLENHTITPAERAKAGKALGFSGPVLSLLQFPSVIDMMCVEIDWTRQLGQAITSGREDVLDAVQRLRTQAVALGNLRSGLQQTVVSEPGEGDARVTIQPAGQYIYVPLYDPMVVYTTSAEAVEPVRDRRAGVPILARFVVFGTGTLIADAFDADYESAIRGWSFDTYYGDGSSRAQSEYRPAYSASFRQARSYDRSGSYPHAYDRGSLSVRNSAYFERFANNANQRPEHEPPQLTSQSFRLADQTPAAAQPVDRLGGAGTLRGRFQ